MSFRNTVVLLVVLVVLGGVVFWVNKRQGGAATNPDATPTPGPLTPLTASDVESIEIKQEDRWITVKRQDDSWVVDSDLPEPADGDKVTQALNRLVGLRPTRTLDDVQNFGDFGLLKPAWTITLQPKEGKAVIFHVGDENPGGTSRYVRVTGDPTVYLVPKLSVEDVQQWLTEPPYQPTPAPEATETPAETPTPAETAKPAETPGPATPAPAETP